MARRAKLIAKMRTSPQNVTYDELRKVCDEYFGEPRESGSSHAVYKMPWHGDPRVNIQRGKDGKAKRYQVEQAIAAIEKYEREL